MNKAVFTSAAVATNYESSGQIGKSMLARGGSAVDAAIAILLVEGLLGMQHMGPGGGFYMTIYSSKNKKAYCLDAREASPLEAHDQLFKKYSISQGAMAAAVPGELLGYWEAHKRFGVLPWKDIIEPAIRMSENGFKVSKKLARAFKAVATDILESPSMRKLLCRGTGEVPVEGTVLTVPQYARTLQIIANSPKGAKELYEGNLTASFINDIKKMGGIITRRDLNNYRVKWKEPITKTFNNSLTMFTSPLPSSGIVLNIILSVLEGLVPSSEGFTIQTAAFLAETMKHAYALRTHLGDPDFFDCKTLIDRWTSPDVIQQVAETVRATSQTHENIKFYGAQFHARSGHGTSNIVVVDTEGNAVCATSTINTLFGAVIASESTGIILNNEMDDFSLPGVINSFGVYPSPANRIEPGKRPLSSMCPTIIVDAQGRVRLAVGGAGGTRITSSVAQVCLRHLWLEESIEEAINAPRIHHQLMPMELKYESCCPQFSIESLKRFGHKMKPYSQIGSVTAVSRLPHGELVACYDIRRGGHAAGF